MRNTNTPGRILVTSKSVFMVTIIVIALTIAGIWLFGIGKHKTLFENSILSTSILSVVFFLLLTIGLYRGIKLKDNVGRITDKIKISKWSDFPEGMDMDFLSGSSEMMGEGIGGIILGILAWILVAFLLLIFIWLFNTIVVTMILVFIAMLYWIFFRALRLVFKNSKTCKGKLIRSMAYGFIYTTLYNCWIYGIILTTHYLIK